MIIDFHAHIGISKVYQDRKYTSDKVIEMMDTCRIDMSILIPTASSRNPEPFKDVVKAVEKYPGRFIGFVLINPKANNALEILEEAVKKYKIRGVKIHPTFMAVAADDEQLVYPIVQKAGELGVPVMIHSGETPWATPWQVGLTALDNPDVTIVMAHMGLAEIINMDAAIKMAKRAPNLILETTGITAEDYIAKAVNEIGPERVVYGSDMLSHHPMVEMEKVKRANITEEAKRLILGDNAKRLFDII